MKTKNIIALLAISFLFSSCFKERIELDLNNSDNKKVVVNAWITDQDEQQSVLLNYTADYFESIEVEYINDADVEIAFGEESVNCILSENGLYLCPEEWRAEPGNTYTLTIRHQGEVYEATSYMRPMPELENVYSEFREETEEELFEEDDDFRINVYFSFQETPGLGDGYFGIDYHKGTAGGDSLLNGDFIDDEFFDGVYFDDINLTVQNYEVGDTAIVETHNIGKDASKYLQDIIVEIFREGLFDPPPVNVRSNISNGAVGYFITSGVQTQELIIEE